ncbi:MAG: neutral/alkaline non-lysosomal ceramidase N-terminal domain-containing protein, partial [Lachnospiraceae bacterium]|nr:neutral/alkaline non-lysosomal ceramidase N-terminal domain-containing protein [Lachnospiraceae bacterium]
MSQIQVGAGKAKIDVPKDLFPFPIYEGFRFDEMGDAGSLYARAIVIDNGVTRFLFIGSDVTNAPGEDLRQRIQEEFFIPVGNMFVTATHNHSAPYGGGSPGGGMLRNPEKASKEAAYRVVYEKGIFEAIKQALKNLRNARYGFGEGKSYINVHRDLLMEDGYWTQGQNFAGPSDKTLAALKFVDEEGNLIGAVVNYAC